MNRIISEFTMISFQKCSLLCLIYINHILFVTCGTYFYNLGNVISDNNSTCNAFLNYAPNVQFHESMANSVKQSYDPLRSNLRSDNDPNIEETDPMDDIERVLNEILFGPDRESGDSKEELNTTDPVTDPLAHYPSGQVMRAELFENKSGVHLPMAQLMHRDHCYLQVTHDHMQTAVNAFSIILEGTVKDILRLPPLYVLRSARAISMMKVAREKLVATWTVIKDGHRTDEITYQTLEMYRPLFKYINGREIAKLNLSDDRILTYIGTHADLDRHQVGVVASKYIRVNKRWNSVKYLNLMNNLLCGVPMIYLRTLGENTYLQLSHQIFYHIRSCDPLQRRFFLHIMTRTQVLGKSNSWSANDVARLGLLLTEVDAPDLGAISPEAMRGITAQVMMEMAPQNLKRLTDIQLKYVAYKPLNILAKKLHGYEDELLLLNSGLKDLFHWNYKSLALQLGYLYLTICNG